MAMFDRDCHYSNSTHKGDIVLLLGLQVWYQAKKARENRRQAPRKKGYKGVCSLYIT